MIALWCLGILGLGLWLALGTASIATRRAVGRLPRQPLVDPPKVSVICPARNEADEIEAAMRSRLNDPADWLEFIAIDDRSTDGTGRILDALVEAQPPDNRRLRVLHVTDLPEGWLGKVHAQQQGIDASTGEWLLLSDGDVHVEPGLMADAIAFARQQQADHVALIPGITRPPLLLQLCLPVLMCALILAMRMWQANDDDAARASGVGAFNLVKRSAFEQAGGMSHLRMEVADDVGVGTIIRASGGRSRLAIATDRVHVAWYRSNRALLEGTQKAAAKARTRWGLLRQAVWGGAITVVAMAPFILLGLWALLPTSLAIVALASTALALGVCLGVERRYGFGGVWSLLTPVGLLVAAALGQRSIWLAFLHGGVSWRGDQHDLARTTEGERVRL